MDNKGYLLVNAPVCTVGLFVNVFSLFCLLCPQQSHKQVLKQPLKVLLTSVVVYNLLLQVTVTTSFFKGFLPYSVDFRRMIALLGMFSAYNSMSMGVWLGIFYYTKIVPAQRPFFIWMQKNIKNIVYLGIAMDRIFLCFEMIYTCLKFTSQTGLTFSFSLNETVPDLKTLLKDDFEFQIFHAMYLSFFIITMTLSWGTTLVYLCRHMKRMERSSGPVSSSRARSQVRVAVLGIIQTVLHFFCSLFVLLDYFSYCDPQNYIILTIFSLYSFGTTVILGLSQSLMRERATQLFCTGLCSF